MRENPNSLVLDPAKELRSFRLAVSGLLGSKRGRGRGSFIDSVLTTIDAFYVDVLGNLRAWSAAPPKLRPVNVEPNDIDDTVPPALTSTDYSSQDGTQEDLGNSEASGQAPIPESIASTALAVPGTPSDGG